MNKVIPDQNILSDTANDEEFNQLLNQAKELGYIEPLFTHVHLDQSNQIKDVVLRDKVLFVVNSNSTTETYGHIEGLSRPRWSTSAPPETLKTILGNQSVDDGKLYDALLASTALHEAAVFVTNDKRLKNRYLVLSKRVMDGQEFKLYLKEFAAKEKLKSSFAKIESDSVTEPDVQMIAKIAKAIGVSMEDLLK